MTADLPCPICTMTDLLESPEQYECITCGHEWPKDVVEDDDHEDGLVVLDANGNRLQDGDSVTVVKGLKVKGGSSDLKVGTKITGIRLVAGDHEVDCKVDGQALMLKAMFLKKA